MKLIPHTRGGALWRFALAAVIVIVFAAATTAVAGLLQFKQFAHDLAVTPALKSAQVTIANPGTAQTLLLIGSDHRAGTSWKTSNTDTMMLVRLDPNSSTINLLSLPRDYKVNVPGHGTERLNSAYSEGGPNLLLKAIKLNGFPHLEVNHIIDVNFGGFSKLIDAIGCVYTDVDHRYYSNTIHTGYSSIDIEPGYQKLCGTDALAFVRFRHTDNDIVRNSRQQDFLRWAKDAFSEAQLIARRDQLIRIFGQNTQTDSDLHSIDGLINLFNLVAFSAGHQVKQISFPAVILPCGPAGPGPAAGVGQIPCYVTANPRALGATYHAFMSATIPHSSAAAPASANNPGGKPAQKPKPGPGGQPKGLTGDLGDGLGQARALGHSSMPVYVPRLIVSGSNYCSPDSLGCTVALGQTPAQVGIPSGYPRSYLIHDEKGNAHPAYRMTLVIDGAIGQYYGVQGTTWRNPPILNKPTQTQNVGGKQLLEYYNGGKISLVAWRGPNGVYWISNTLNDQINNAQMVAIAGSLTAAR